MKTETKEKFSKLHDKYYKLALIIPAIILILCLVYMINFYSSNGDFIYKDISLKGGTSATLYGKIDISDLESKLSGSLEELRTRQIYDLVTREQKAVVIETTTPGDEVKQVLEDYLGYKLDNQNSSFEFSESSFTQGFYKQLLWANLIAFILMSIVVFILFRSFVPSFTVISCVLIDILMTLVAVNMLGVRISTAGIIAFLMLIGYSVDTDILLTTRLMKHEGDLNRKIYGAFKTGITMTLTSLLAIIAAMIIVSSFSEILKQIFLIITIGLIFDILNTWLTNVSILKWYLEAKK
jgi:preprotein translocase subunit SecF